jgi:hypothetical protein
MWLLTKLIKNNTGVSSKNFFLVAVTIIGCLLLLVPVFALTIEAIFMHTIATDLTGMAAYIGAVSAVLASGGFTKVVSEKYERPWMMNKPDMFNGIPEEDGGLEQIHTEESI